MVNTVYIKVVSFVGNFSIYLERGYYRAYKFVLVVLLFLKANKPQKELTLLTMLLDKPIPVVTFLLYSYTLSEAEQWLLLLATWTSPKENTT